MARAELVELSKLNTAIVAKFINLLVAIFYLGVDVPCRELSCRPERRSWESSLCACPNS